jgi:hypothetical protein
MILEIGRTGTENIDIKMQNQIEMNDCSGDDAKENREQGDKDYVFYRFSDEKPAENKNR